MSGARRAAVVAAGAVLVALATAFVVWRAVDDGSPDASSRRSPTSAVVVDVTEATAPFESMTAGVIRVGDRDVPVVVADSPDERVRGLRGRPGPAPYEGMLFVFDEVSTAGFTMAGVPEPLDIAFFDASGRRIDELRMVPCAGTDATCPLYRASAPYRYTLETAPNQMPEGGLRVVRG